MTTTVEPEVQLTPDMIVGREFRFAFHIPANAYGREDMHFIKEQVHYKVGDKTIIRPGLRMIPNFERPVFITKPNARVHKEKKEVEKIENLIRVDTTQSDLKKVIMRMTNNRSGYASLRQLCASPYVYGADIPSTLHLRQAFYDSKHPNLVTPRTVAMFDTETNMFSERKEIIMASACFENKAVVVVDKSFVKGYTNVKELFQDKCSKHLAKYIEEHNLEIDFYLADTEIDILKQIFMIIHGWQPDFLAIWNMNFDIPKVLAACEFAGVDPADILCDPRVPKTYRVCEYVPGNTSKLTASGKHMPITPANQWHTFNLTASFYVIDAMCAYRRIRGGAELSSYGLDAILGKELKLSKLKIPEADKYIKGEWHKFMQSKMPFDYIAYNIFDSFAMLLLDLKTKDLSRTLSYLAQGTSFSDYSSQTKRLRDNFYVFAFNNLGLILGSLGPKKDKAKVEYVPVSNDDDFIEDADAMDEGGEDEFTVLDRRNWVITLRAFMSVPGLPLIRENKNVRTLIRAFVYDSDVVSSYPNCILVANVSKLTTRKEVGRIGEIPEQIFRMQNLNFIFGQTNSLEYGQVMFKLPTFRVMNSAYRTQLAKDGQQLTQVYKPALIHEEPEGVI